MAIDAFTNEQCPILPVKSLTPAGVPNIINLSFLVGNSGTTAATAVTLVKTLIVPTGVELKVLDNGGSIISPAGTVFFAGPNSFIFTNLTLPAISFSDIALHGFNVTLQVIAGSPPFTIKDITQVIADGDVNPENNTATCEITLR